MAILIQKKTGIVNIINTAGAAGETIFDTMSLDCVAVPINKPNPEISIIQILDCDGNPNRQIQFIPSLEVQDDGGAAAPFVGTMDEIIDKLNNEYFVVGSSGGTPVLPADASTETKQDIQIDQFDEVLSKLTRKKNGVVWDLDTSVDESWPGYPFNVNGFATYASGDRGKQVAFLPVNEPTINDVDDLISLLNTNIEFFTFSRVDESTTDKIFISDSSLLASNITEINIGTSVASLEYDVTGFSAPVKEDLDGTLDFILMALDNITNLIEVNKFSNWELIQGNYIEYEYYVGVQSGNPSGDANLKFALYKSGATGTVELSQTFKWDINNNVLSIQTN